MSVELFRALEEGNDDAFQQAGIFTSGLEETGKLNVLRSFSDEGNSVLHFAICRSRINAIKFILSQLTDDGICKLLDVKDNDGNCPLHVASQKRQVFPSVWNAIPGGKKLACAEILNASKMNLLHTAVQFDLTDVIKLILRDLLPEEFMNLLASRTSGGLTALHMAVSLNNLNLILLLLLAIPRDQRADFIRENVSHRGNQTILHMAKHSQTFIRILETTSEGGQVELLTKWYFNNNTLFWWIADSQRVDHLNTIRGLLGSDRWAKLVFSPEGYEALQCAVREHKVNVVSCLLEGLERMRKYEILCKMNGNNDFPLSMANQGDIREIIAMVEGRNIDASVIRTFLHMANNVSHHYVLHGGPRALILYDLTDRPGAIKEKNRMIEALSRVGITDIRESELHMGNLSASIELARDDGVSALLVCLMSHGCEGFLQIGPEQHLFSIQSIIDSMQSHGNSPPWPKVLILQACQLGLPPQHVLGETTFNIKDKHSAIVSCTLPGQLAERNLFIPALAEAIREFGQKYDLFVICTRANRRVNPVHPQIPNFRSSFDRSFFFKWLQRVDL